MKGGKTKHGYVKNIWVNSIISNNLGEMGKIKTKYPVDFNV